MPRSIWITIGSSIPAACATAALRRSRVRRAVSYRTVRRKKRFWKRLKGYFICPSTPLRMTGREHARSRSPRSSGNAAEAAVAQSPPAGRRKLRKSPPRSARTELAHRLPRSALSESRRMLGRRHRNHHDSRGCVYARLPFLRGQNGKSSRRSRLARAEARGRSGGEDGLEIS